MRPSGLRKGLGGSSHGRAYGLTSSPFTSRELDWNTKELLKKKMNEVGRQQPPADTDSQDKQVTQTDLSSDFVSRGRRLWLPVLRVGYSDSARKAASVREDVLLVSTEAV